MSFERQPDPPVSELEFEEVGGDQVAPDGHGGYYLQGDNGEVVHITADEVNGNN